MPQQDSILFHEIKLEIFEVSNFGHYTEIENSENLDIFSRLVTDLLYKLEISEVFEFSILVLILKSKIWKTRNLLQDL